MFYYNASYFVIAVRDTMADIKLTRVMYECHECYTSMNYPNQNHDCGDRQNNEEQYDEGYIEVPQDVRRRAEGDELDHDNEYDSDNDEGFVIDTLETRLRLL
jgi:hypothetical protein